MDHAVRYSPDGLAFRCACGLSASFHSRAACREHGSAHQTYGKLDADIRLLESLERLDLARRLGPHRLDCAVWSEEDGIELCECEPCPDGELHMAAECHGHECPTDRQERADAYWSEQRVWR